MKKLQRGMTLVELMISLMLSLGLIAGITSLFVQMQKSNHVQRALNATSDDTNYAQDVLQKELRRAGGLRSRTDVNGIPAKVFLKTNHDVSEIGSGIAYTQNGQYIRGVTDANGNDAFVMRYQLVDDQDLSVNVAANNNSPCTQNVLLNDPSAANPSYSPALSTEDPDDFPHVVGIYFYLAATPTTVNPNMKTLTCVAQRVAQGSVAAGGEIALPPTTENCIRNCAGATNFSPYDTTVITLVPNVVQLGVNYGVDSDGDGAANYYVSAVNVPAAGCTTSTGAAIDCWQRVVSVRLSMVTQSEDNFLAKTPMSYQFNGATVTPPATITVNSQSVPNLFLYKSITTTIALRN